MRHEYRTFLFLLDFRAGAGRRCAPHGRPSAAPDLRSLQGARAAVRGRGDLGVLLGADRRRVRHAAQRVEPAAADVDHRDARMRDGVRDHRGRDRPVGRLAARAARRRRGDPRREPALAGCRDGADRARARRADRAVQRRGGSTYQARALSFIVGLEAGCSRSRGILLGVTGGFDDRAGVPTASCSSGRATCRAWPATGSRCCCSRSSRCWWCGSAARGAATGSRSCRCGRTSRRWSPPARCCSRSSRRSTATAGIPVPVLLLLALLGVFSWIATQTVFGRRIYAVGSNLEATRLSGVDTDRVKLAIFALMGLMCAFAGIVNHRAARGRVAVGRHDGRARCDRRMLHRAARRCAAGPAPCTAR
ncbi:Ribose/xylose/arabinose/galactoside ABC-type transport system permease component [Burkholderia dolosa AU0158]|nr:Ribose/xylose/arabinose/galactoside ABC-type transport system permease component [Burkholderia dolosa AU0158]